MIEKTEKEIMKNWKANEKPLVSVCSITYNHEKFIEASLDSMLMQETNFPFEIIIHDDCSTDKTATIIREYAKKFPHIISPVLATENKYSKGVSVFSPIYEKAVGRYVAILEGDDYWRDDLKLQKQVDFLDNNNNNDYVLSYNNSIVIDEDNQLVRKIRNPSSKDYTRDQMICGEVTISTNTVMFRKVNLALENKKNILGGDIVLWHVLGRHGKSKYQEEIIYSAYREHSGGVWSRLDHAEQCKNFIKTRQFLKKECHDNFKLKSRIDRSMNKMAAIWLFNSITSFDFKLLKTTVKQIVHNEDLSIFKSIMLLPTVLLKKMKNKMTGKKR